MKKGIIFFLMVMFFCEISAQQDTIFEAICQKECTIYQKLILSGALVVGGSILKLSYIQKVAHEETQEVFGSKFKFHGDDYFQFVPAAQLLVGNLIGFKSENSYKQLITNSVLSNLFVTIAAQTCKRTLNDRRPDGVGLNSFPSGHTTTAFNNATMLFLEYKDSNIWYASSGYLFATATGVLRMANNRHWVGDVVAGVGLGTGIAILVHHWNPVIFKNKKEKTTSFIGYPVINQNTYGLGMLYQMK